jgi:hypothetical protein
VSLDTFLGSNTSKLLDEKSSVKEYGEMCFIYFLLGSFCAMSTIIYE